MEIRHMSFPLKLMLGYLVGILLLTLLFSISMGHLSTVSRDYDSLVRNTWRQLNAVQNLHSAVLNLRIDLAESLPRAKNDLKQVDYWFMRFLKFSGGGASRDFPMLVREFYAFRLQALELMDRMEKKHLKDPASDDIFMKKYNSLLIMVSGEIEKTRRQADVSETRFLRRINELLFLNTILAPLSFLFLYVYGYFISNHTGLRLRAFLSRLQKILAGDYQERILDKSQDEIGQIAQGVNELASRLSKR
jgi:methyl-accepting chemotaxis protein